MFQLLSPAEVEAVKTSYCSTAHDEEGGERVATNSKWIRDVCSFGYSSSPLSLSSFSDARAYHTELGVAFAGEAKHLLYIV